MLAPIASQLVSMIGFAIHQLRTASAPLPNVVWIPTVDEADAMAGPLARIAARHMPAGTDAASGDVADALELGLAGTAYVMAHAPADKLIRAGHDPATGQPFAAPAPPLDQAA